MTEQQPAVPATESRGGEHPDWDQVRPYEELTDPRVNQGPAEDGR